jgi:cardiolipin synthase A/B
VWAIFIGILHLSFSIPTAVHILLRKEDERAATAWIGLVLLSPVLGSALYWMFGINRINTHNLQSASKKKKADFYPLNKSELESGCAANWRALIHAGYAIDDDPYLSHNNINPLLNGDAAYPPMLDAIANAKCNIFLSSYIFDFDKIGRKFVAALSDARKRNIAVYVLIEGDLLDYRWRITKWQLHHYGIKTARLLPVRPRFINLRNHRKILVIDNEVAFLGGLNIRQANMVQETSDNAVQDIHFQIVGPVVEQISKAFAGDWEFATSDSLDVSSWNASNKKSMTNGTVSCRVLLDGPNDSVKKLQWILLMAINTAKYNIRILTPYFIPGHILICALQAAALRGIEVEIMVPEKNNIPFFNWAMQANFNNFIQYGLTIYLSASPFDHSKLFLIDDYWSFFGSANWDARSLALNFEINLECFDKKLNTSLTGIFNQKKMSAKMVKKMVPGKYSLFIQARDNFFRLLSPYL